MSRAILKLPESTVLVVEKPDPNTKEDVIVLEEEVVILDAHLREVQAPYDRLRTSSDDKERAEYGRTWPKQFAAKLTELGGTDYAFSATEAWMIAMNVVGLTKELQKKLVPSLLLSPSTEELGNSQTTSDISSISKSDESEQ